MKHYGDITQLRGEQLEPVDIIIGGSPCQNLSTAGNRQGLSGEQSSLFLEQIRIVKESRKCHGKPRFMLWENVPGALTSNNGEDFRRVLEETVRIKEGPVSIPRPANGKWSNAGCIMGDGFSVAWRIHDAQYWGVPQRRRRIALVADFGGESAPEILFEYEGMSGSSKASRATREGSAGNTESDADQTVWCLQGNGIDRADTAGCNGRGWREDISYTLNTIDRPAVCAGFSYGTGAKAGNIGYEPDRAPTLRAGSNDAAVCYDMTHANDVIRDCGEVSPTLQNRMGTGGNQIPLCIGNGQANQLRCQTRVGALNCMHDQQCVVHTGIIRRLTPLECERLQGYPDGWSDIDEWTDAKGKKHKTSDTARYKALGNSIALPFWHWLLNRFASYLPESPTMGSLFDGIGGFPLCWERIYGKGTAVWASEIEPFCIAVTERRINGDSLSCESEDLRS